MIKSLFKTSLYIAVFFGFFIIFLPIKNLYFSLENELLKKHIILDEEKLEQRFLKFGIQKSKLYHNNELKGDIKNIELNYMFLFNSFIVKDMKLDKNFLSFPPMKIELLKLEYTLLNPVSIDIVGTGEFGKLSGYIDLLKNEINLFIKPSSMMRSTMGRYLRQMKNEKGVYNYVYKY